MIHILTATYSVFRPFGGRDTGPIELDMGCGKGHFTVDLAARYPERCILGADIMLGRLRKVASKARRRHLSNVELLRSQNRELAAFQLPAKSIQRLHLLCPDPWPKDKHRDKRLVTTDFLCRLRRILVPGGVLHLATDHDPYFEDWQRMLADLPFFVRDDDAIADVADLRTGFELQWMEQGKTVPHMAFRCVGDG
ncbi:MAG: methyltransferase domain-containing protein [Victivallales bacterium]|nr:methyltransferase domain-containing protein [Victivallales bacterium]